MPKTTYQANLIITHFFRTDSVAKPSALYVGLFGENPTEDGTQTSEITGGSYARVQINPSNSNWGAPVNGRTGSLIVVTFPAPTADWNDGDPIPYAGILDAATGGNMRYYGALTTPKRVNNGDPAPTIPIDALAVVEA